MVSDQRIAERAILLTVALGTMLAPLNSTMIVVALPEVMLEFSAGVYSVGWLVTAYLIVMASLQLVAGKLGDRLGRRHIMLVGLAYFGIASLGAAMASSLPMLFFFRVQQAIAGAVVLPNGAALVREVVPLSRRAGGFGLVGAAVALAAATGPPLGGLLAGIAGWRAIFYANVPLILTALLLGRRAIPAGRAQGTGRPFDLTGAVLLSAILLGAAGLLTQVRWGDTVLLLTLGGTALVSAAALFLWREFRHPDPVLQPRFFLRRSFAVANAAIALSTLTLYTTLLAIPILLSRRAGWASAEIGLVLAALSVTMIAFAPIGGRLADRLGRRWPAVVGLSLLTLGLLPLALAGSGIALPALLGSLSVAGAGLGLSSASLQTAAIESVGPREAGVASGIFSTSRYFGGIIGSGLLTGLLDSSQSSGGFDAVFPMVVVAGFLSVVVGFGLRDWPTAEPNST